jgi:acetate kinase
MNVLAINCGSSSIKCGVFETAGRSGGSTGARRLASGRIEKLGADKAQLRFETGGGAPVDTTEALRDHAEAVRRIAE